MDESSSPTLKYITDSHSELPMPTNEESFTLLHEALRMLQGRETLGHVIVHKLEASYSRCNELLKAHLKGDHNPLALKRIRLVYESRCGNLENYVFLTEDLELYWMSVEFHDLEGDKILTFEALAPEHSALFNQRIHADPTQQRVAFHVLESLLALIDEEAEKRIWRGQRLKNNISDIWPWLGRAKELGYDPYLM